MILVKIFSFTNSVIFRATLPSGFLIKSEMTLASKQILSFEFKIIQSSKSLSS